MNDNAANTTIVDSSGKGNTGTAQRNTSVLHIAGKIDGALHFNENQPDYIDVGTMGNFGKNMNNITVSAWLRSSDNGTRMALLGVANYGANTALFIFLNSNSDNQLSAGRIQVFIRDDSASNMQGAVNSDTGITDGDWHHLIVVIQKSAGAVAVYVDNEEQTFYHKDTGTGTNFSNFQYPLLSGAHNNRGTSAYHFSTLSADEGVDVTMIFDKVLSAPERAFLYNGGNGTEKLKSVARPLVGGSLVRSDLVGKGLT